MSFSDSYFWGKIEDLQIELHQKDTRIAELEANIISLTQRNVELVEENKKMRSYLAPFFDEKDAWDFSN